MTESIAVTGHEATATPLVSVAGVSKRFGGVIAIKRTDITLYPGEVHALLGENGAGKSTLVNILAGIVQPDAGTLTVSGDAVTIHNPHAARALGISVVHQHPVVFPDLTVAENIMFAAAPPRTALHPWTGKRCRPTPSGPWSACRSI